MVLHVGVPKSGTSYVQSGLREHRDALAARGIHVPRGPREVMFRAALDVRGNHAQWGRDRSEVAGLWEDLCRRAGAHDGVTVLSHELLAAATPAQASAARATLARLAPDHRVDLVVTARDPARPLIAEWQENLKGGDHRTFARFWSYVGRAIADDDHSVRFWAAQDVPDVVRRWGGDLPPDQVHVVTCPPRGSAPEDLWRRFAAATGLPMADLLPQDPESNTGLGATEIAVLRAVNEALDGRLPHPTYGPAVKGALVRQVLARRRSPRPALPVDAHVTAETVAERWTSAIAEAGWRVHGSLTELVPAPRTEGPGPDDVSDADLAAASSAVIADLLVALEQAHTAARTSDADAPATSLEPCSPRFWWPTAARSRSGLFGRRTRWAPRRWRSSRTRTAGPSTA